MKITLYEFLALSDLEQFNIVFTIGEYIDVSIEGNKRFVLYAIDLFFVEVEYDNVGNKIISKRAIDTGKILDKYSQL